MSIFLILNSGGGIRTRILRLMRPACSRCMYSALLCSGVCSQIFYLVQHGVDLFPVGNRPVFVVSIGRCRDSCASSEGRLAYRTFGPVDGCVCFGCAHRTGTMDLSFAESSRCDPVSVIVPYVADNVDLSVCFLLCQIVPVDFCFMNHSVTSFFSEKNSGRQMPAGRGRKPSPS